MDEPEIDRLKDKEPNNHDSSQDKACDVLLKQEKSQRQQCKKCRSEIKSFPDSPDTFRVIYDHIQSVSFHCDVRPGFRKSEWKKSL
jgi:hypothetical protein